jgi:CRISPR-associated protein Cas2
MKAKRLLTVVAYDIEDDRARNKTAKHLERYGSRVNYSVFECLFTPAQYEKTRGFISKMINNRTDRVVLYRVCVDCYTKTEYLPQKASHIEAITVI